MTKFEYVMSGMNYPTFSQNTFQDPNFVEECRVLWAKLQSHLPGHSYGMLYNGFQEKLLGDKLQLIFGKIPYYVDSGGLQMITLGLDIDDAKKKEIYQTQAKHGTYAMSFDEIPLKLHSQRSTFHDVKSRSVDIESFVECAKKSGQNVKEQIAFFLSINSDTKPFIIIQGYDLASYQLWADLLLGEIPEEHHKHIGGVSIGAACLGQGDMEDFTRSFICSSIVLPEHLKHIHLLGVGSIKRLLPIVALSKNGKFEDCLVSYDSTSHTSSLSLGGYQMGDKMMSFKYGNLLNYEKIKTDVKTRAEKYFNKTFEYDFIYDVQVGSRESFLKKYEKNREQDFQALKYILLFSGIMNFVEELENVKTNFNSWVAENKENPFPFLSFSKVNDEKDFLEWQKMNWAMVSSKKVPLMEEGQLTMESLFE